MNELKNNYLSFNERCKIVKKDNSFLFILYYGFVNLMKEAKENICIFLNEYWFPCMFITSFLIGVLGLNFYYMYYNGGFEVFHSPLIKIFFSPIIICLVASLFIGSYKHGVEELADKLNK
ncbi:hypothetical protein [Bacillus paralicheniformis]|uniref:hypothetical protein n=1 Tax=Bacillus paralicheniformis TaxID=1648923 RepID=UPI001FD63726|nr:hypothetical protein [Bacillus paralicheniformis]MCJ8223703.1 hypothetical protein [Bacillus paralicheniformis]